MQFGTWIPTSGPLTSPSAITTIATMAEELGFEFLRGADHLVLPKEPQATYPFGDPHIDFSQGYIDLFTTQAYVAAKTQTIQLHIGCALLALRNPFAVAKHIAMIDHLSGGRARFEVGVGWLRDEFDVLRVPWEERGRRTDEYLAVIRCLFESGGPFAGEFFEFPEVWFGPGPVQRPFPIYIAGGVAPAALRRVATFGQGWTPAIVSFDAVAAAIPQLDEALERRGRTRAEIDIQYRLDGVRGEPGERDELLRQLDEMRRVGITAVCVNFADMKKTGSLDDVRRTAEWFASEVMPATSKG